ncbi:hypothetical protein CA265_18170 [Sphingobacteriaceae bacterium GW460-11-11-14-LB5]|nr:hypothetical protein CA265_18170 [Sphingobacteriaceae bacterium GW460-11-11-14-LB5]
MINFCFLILKRCCSGSSEITFPLFATFDEESKPLPSLRFEKDYQRIKFDKGNLKSRGELCCDPDLRSRTCNRPLLFS